MVSKTRRDLFRDIDVSNHEKNDVREGFKSPKATRPVFGSMDLEYVKAKPFGCFAALTSSTYHAQPEGADGERTPTFYLGLKSY